MNQFAFMEIKLKSGEFSIISLQFIDYQKSTRNLYDICHYSRVFRLKLITQGHNSTVTFFQSVITPLMRPIIPDQWLSKDSTD